MPLSPRPGRPKQLIRVPHQYLRFEEKNLRPAAPIRERVGFESDNATIDGKRADGDEIKQANPIWQAKISRCWAAREPRFGQFALASMSYFFFNFRQDGSYSVDTDGCEFANVEDAYLACVDSAREIWRECLIRRENPLACSFEVTDKSGHTLFVFAFSEVLDACRGRDLRTSSGHSGD